jgi:hypothetical protein
MQAGKRLCGRCGAAQSAPLGAKPRGGRVKRAARILLSLAASAIFLAIAGFLAVAYLLPNGAVPSGFLFLEDLVFVRKTDVWDGGAKAFKTSVAGDREHPYIIDTAEKLAYLAIQVSGGNGYAGKFFRLERDLDLANKPWAPIGAAVEKGGNEYDWRYFDGDFDGNGHAISNMKIDLPEESPIGLFGGIRSGDVRSLKLVGVDVCGEAGVGALAGTNDGKISNCTATGRVRGKKIIGGFVGINMGSISDSAADCDVSGEERVGALIGFNFSKVSNCTAGGSVASGESIDGDGLIGWDFSSGQVLNSASTSRIVRKK